MIENGTTAAILKRFDEITGGDAICYPSDIAKAYAPDRCAGSVETKWVIDAIETGLLGAQKIRKRYLIAREEAIRFIKRNEA